MILPEIQAPPPAGGGVKKRDKGYESERKTVKENAEDTIEYNSWTTMICSLKLLS